MKKTASLAFFVLALFWVSIAAPGVASAEDVLKIGATPVPHAEILEFIKGDVAKDGVAIKVIEFTDYVKPNLALNDGEIDANFFQHAPYLEDFNANHGTKLVSVGAVHVEPLGLYSQKVKSVDELKDGALIAIPSDSVNGARALLLLEANGLIDVDGEAGLAATERDIIENPKKLKFKAIEAAQLPRVLPDVDGAVINGNYALEAGLNPAGDAILLEGAESPYANILVVKEGNEGDPRVAVVLKHLQSEKVAEFILSRYEGGVVPAF
ncbi:MAG: D-methionine transport system substrate-binding protein [Synergistales bacterium]|nr:D-methionine transport system substrate-binding protein [Synergistales bacterium]